MSWQLAQIIPKRIHPLHEIEKILALGVRRVAQQENDGYSFKFLLSRQIKKSVPAQFRAKGFGTSRAYLTLSCLRSTQNGSYLDVIYPEKLI